ncbi:helix-turn-helix domain-containing protein [Kocuria sp. CPCC 205263]|uniref:helix-turn-helix domain-containing protein n=1 Tax=Kocuria sp. CPCC 205263 TaxID=3073555 RepID=UPI0034D4F1F9
MLNPTVLEGLDVSHVSCAPACALFDLPDVHVLTIERHRSSFALVVETVPSLACCPSCGVLAIGHGRVPVLLHDLPCVGVPVRVVWRKRRYRCHETACEVTTFSEVHELAAPRAKLPTRAIAWAVAQLRAHDIAVSALAQMLGVAWNTVWDAVASVAQAQLAAEDRLAGVNALGVDEHVWRHVGPPGTELVTGIVDHSRDNSRPRARLLDLVPGRTGTVYADWLSAQGPAFTSGIRTATLDPFHG